MPFKHLDETLDLVGTGDPYITFLKGGQWESERTTGLFKKGIWTFNPDGTFVFRPSCIIAVRADLYPISGSYILVKGVLEIQGRQRSAVGTASSSLDGSIQVRSGLIYLDIIHEVVASALCIAHVVQILSPLFLVHLDTG